MRATLRAHANQLFVKHPRLGQLGYDFLRVSGLDRSTRGTRTFLRALQQRGFVPRVVVDVGANYGGWSRAAHGVFPEAQFFLIEPQEEMRPFLENFCAAVPGSRYFLAGAAAAPGEMTLTVWDDYQGTAFIPDAVRALTPYTRQRTVPVVTLGGLVTTGEMPPPDLIKIDVQGLETTVLQGSIACFDHTELFIVETSLFNPLGERPSFYRVTEFMEAYGYRIYDLQDLKHRPSDGALGQVDVCFAKAGGLLRASPKWSPT